MSLPPKVDIQIRQRFDDLIKDGQELVALMSQDEIQTRENYRRSNIFVMDDLEHQETKFYTYKTKCSSLLAFMSGRNEHLTNLLNEIRSLRNTIPDAQKLLGIVVGLKDDYESGMLNNLSNLIEGNIVADYLGQAEQLLNEGQPGKFDHVPAAVLTGAILEDALRRLCNRQVPPIPTTDGKGNPKTFNLLIDDLKKAGVYNELKAKQLRGWADIRNAAAHGEFAKFNRQDVELMLKGVQSFLADYI